MTGINFNELPSDIKSMIYKVNKDKEQEEYYKNNYKNFVNNFKDTVKGDSGEYYRNDITYTWMNTYKTGWSKDINDYKEMRASMKQIKEVIDYGRVDSY